MAPAVFKIVAPLHRGRWVQLPFTSATRFHRPILFIITKKGAAAIQTAAAPGLQILLPYWEKMFLAVLIFRRTPQVTPGAGYP